MQPNSLMKFIPFAKVDEAKRQVWGIVTAELPDKDDEVCDYDGSKPYYEAVIAEMSKATDGKNYFPLREMHGLAAAGKCIGFEFRDDAKEIFMGFEVVDDEAWKKVQKNVYTGFSQGGRVVGDRKPDPTYKGCMRYVANPSEASLVDNPCLAAAHFAYVKADGAVELRKFAKTEAVSPDRARLTSLEAEVALIKAANAGKAAGATKRVSGEDLPSSAFLIVGDKNKADTWHLPVKFSNETKTKSHIRAAIARFSQVKSISAADKVSVWKKLVALAGKHDIDVESEQVKFAAIQDSLRKRARAAVNRERRKIADVGHSLSFLDADLGKLHKGLYEVSRLAEFVQGLSYMVYAVASEQEWEQDKDSALPTMIADNVHSLIDTLVAMVAEETTELRNEIDARVS